MRRDRSPRPPGSLPTGTAFGFLLADALFSAPDNTDPSSAGGGTVSGADNSDQSATADSAGGGSCVSAPTIPDFNDPTKSPGSDWEWRGPDSPGGSRGAWYNPATGESLHPDLGHPDPIGPHWDWTDPDGDAWRIGGDGIPVRK